MFRTRHAVCEGEWQKYSFAHASSIEYAQDKSSSGRSIQTDPTRSDTAESDTKRSASGYA